MNHEEKLKSMGIILPQAPPPVAAYIPAIQIGKLIYTSGQGTYKDGKLHYIGRVGREISLEEAYEAAKLTAINCLVAAVTVAGSINNIKRIIHVRGFINSDDNFHDQPKVLNGASEFLQELLEKMENTPGAPLGTSNLPDNICVETEMILELN